MKKTVFFLAITLIVFFSSCDLFTAEKNKNTVEEPIYNAAITWQIKTNIRRLPIASLGENCVYVFEDAEAGFSSDFILTKLDAKTGKRLWSSVPVPPMRYFATAVEYDKYVYLFADYSILYFFEKETGRLAAVVEPDLGSNYFMINTPAMIHENYLYHGIGIAGEPLQYLVRFDLTQIDYNRANPEAPQIYTPEILWTSKEGRPVFTEPVIKDRSIYFATYGGIGGEKTEIAGVDIDTKQEVWYAQINHDNAQHSKALSINGDTLYFLAISVSAYDLKTKTPLYIKEFPIGTSPETDYGPSGQRGFVLYRDKLYYTNNASRTPSDKDGYKNIFCVDAKTGNMTWGAIAPWSESLGTNPVVYNGKAYVNQDTGLRVYDADSGKLIGLDSSLCGIGYSTNVLYQNYMVTFNRDPDTGIASVIAINVE